VTTGRWIAVGGEAKAMLVTARRRANPSPAHRERRFNWRVKVGYARGYPSATASSNSAVAKHVRIVRQTLRNVVGDGFERVRAGRRAHPGLAVAVDVSADGTGP
jgi:hypothetical protein